MLNRIEACTFTVCDTGLEEMVYTDPVSSQVSLNCVNINVNVTFMFICTFSFCYFFFVVISIPVTLPSFMATSHVILSLFSTMGSLRSDQVSSYCT